LHHANKGYDLAVILDRCRHGILRGKKPKIGKIAIIISSHKHFYPRDNSLASPRELSINSPNQLSREASDMEPFTAAAGSRHRIILIVAVIVVIVAGVVVTVALSRSHRGIVSQTGAVGEYRACLVTTTGDTATADSVWQAIQAADNGIVVQTQRTLISTASSATQVSDLYGVLSSQCGLVVTVGSDLHNTVATVATAKPAQKFLSAGSTVALPNVQNVSATPVPTAEITKVIQRAAQLHYGGTTGTPAPPVDSQ
jgi:hypothetical protein